MAILRFTTLHCDGLSKNRRRLCPKEIVASPEATDERMRSGSRDHEWITTTDGRDLCPWCAKQEPRQ